MPFAAALSEYVSIWRRSRSSVEPELGRPFGAGERGDGNRQLQGRCSRERRPRVPGRAGSRRQVLDVDPARAPEALRELLHRSLQQDVVARRAHHRRRGAGGAEHVRNGGAAPAAVAVDGDHLDGGLAWRQRDPELEVPAARAACRPASASRRARSRAACRAPPCPQRRRRRAGTAPAARSPEAVAVR